MTLASRTTIVRSRYSTSTLLALMTAATMLLGACSGSGSGNTLASAGDGGSGDPSPSADAGASFAGTLAGPEPSCPAIGAPANVTQDDLYGYPPYASYGCRLAYVKADTGALVLRDLRTGAENQIAPASEHPHRPTVSADVVAWESSNAQGSSELHVLYNDVTTVLSAAFGAQAGHPFDHAGEPRAANGVVVFTAWSAQADTSDTDVLLYGAVDKRLVVVAGGPAQQRFADISENKIAVTDFIEDPDGTFNENDTDLADIGILDRALGTYALRKNPGKDAFPVLVSDDALGYLHWGDHRPEPKFQAFAVMGASIPMPASADKLLQDVETNVFVRPSGRYGELFWVTQNLTDGMYALNHAPTSGATPPAAVTNLGGALGAPAASKAFTLVAVQSGTLQSLRAVSR
jgi:hypothetical protein